MGPLFFIFRHILFKTLVLSISPILKKLQEKAIAKKNILEKQMERCNLEEGIC